MLEIALGYLNMSPDDFWDFTPRLFQLKLEGKRKVDYELQKQDWERMRYQTVCLINKDRKRSEQLKLTDLVKFEWEEKTAKKQKLKDYKKAMYLIHKTKKENSKKV
jgi:hypothetical protein